ncbi:MAG: hypothetical protein ABI678_02280 [Kofleriaceae bacterium]
MGFEFSETMAGTVEWDAEPGKRHPFRFDITAHADSTRAHLMDGRATIHGTVYAPPKTRSAPAEGTITIRPVGQKIIRYELAFSGDDGQPYELVGQKDISYLRPFTTFTTLPAEIVDAQHHRVGTALTRFDLKRHWWRFLRSFRSVPRRRPA